MKFERTLTQDEIVLLGTDPERRLHTMINIGLNAMSHLQCVDNAVTRILYLMTNTPADARTIKDSHNSVYGDKPITLNYARYVIHMLHGVGKIERTSRGKYIKREDAT